MKILWPSFLSALLCSFGVAASAHPGSPRPVHLLDAGKFVILSKTGISDVPGSKITGNIGTSPITGAADHLSCAEVTGRVFSVDAAGPAPCSVATPKFLTTAVLNMQAAYTDAAGRAPDVTELGAGNISGLTLKPGVYKWSTGVLIASNVTLQGSSTDHWIFQIAKNLQIDNGQQVILSGGALPRHIYWQVAGQVNIGTTASFAGNILSKTLIAVKTGASVRGRLLAQTAVTLEKNTVTGP